MEDRIALMYMLTQAMTSVTASVVAFLAQTVRTRHNRAHA